MSIWPGILLPPLLGAIIGYVTNALAIRMLFRPRTKKYLFGKIPLPQGIIPRQREKLAHSIARMVSNSLFNAEVILQHIRGAKFQDVLQTQLSELFTPSFDRLPAQQTGDEHVSIRGRIEQIEQLVLAVLKAPLGRGILRSLLQWMGRHIGSLSLSSLLPLNMRNNTGLTEFIRGQIEGEGFRRLSWSLVLWLRRQEADNIPVGHFFSKKYRDRNIHAFDRFYIPMVNFLLDFLRRPEIRRELIRRGKVILSDILAKLTPVQRIVLSAGQYDRTLEENMPSIVDDLTKTLEVTLRSKQNREKILSAAHEFLSKLFNTGLRDAELEYDISLSRSAYRLCARIRTILIQENWAESLVEQIGKNTRSVNDLLQAYGNTTLDELLMQFYSLVTEWIDNPEKRDQFREHIVGFVSKAGMGQKRKESSEDREMIGSLADMLTILVEGAIPSLVEQFNIYQMVVDRINALDVKEVEDLLLGIIARHLKYINIIGAIIGAIIGGVQVLFSVLSQ